MPLAGFGRCAFLPYFDKRSDIMGYFPQDPKRWDLRDFPVSTGMLKMEIEPNSGLFRLWVHNLFFTVV